MKRWQPRGAICVVTGASSGIGRELARLLVAEGATVYALARRAERLQELADQTQALTGRMIPRAGDISDANFCAEVLREITQQHQRLDLLVNGAGIGGHGPFLKASSQRMRRIFEINFFAAADLTRAAFPLLEKSTNAVICNISSVLGHCAVPDKSEYCASKFALHGWSDALRAELAEKQIQVTLVSPSTTATEFFDAAIEPTGDAKRGGFGTMTAEQVAAIALTAIRKRRREVILSIGGKLLVWLDRLCPPLSAKILAKFG